MPNLNEPQAQEHLSFIAKIAQRQADEDLDRRKQELQAVLSRKFGYAAERRRLPLLEQGWLFLLLCAIVWRANVVSIVYLLLSMVYMLMNDKTAAIAHISKVVFATAVLQYSYYLLNLTSFSSPQHIPEGPYPSLENSVGQYFVPFFFKFEFIREQIYPFWLCFAGTKDQLKSLWFDFLLLVYSHAYLKVNMNPVLNPRILKFPLENKDESRKVPRDDFNWSKSLEEYHARMQEKYPSDSVFERLKDLKEQNSVFVQNRSSKILIYTASHILVMILVLLIALFQRSIVSLVYIILISYSLVQSVDVLRQHDWYSETTKRQQELLRLRIALQF